MSKSQRNRSLSSGSGHATVKFNTCTIHDQSLDLKEPEYSQHCGKVREILSIFQ